LSSPDSTNELSSRLLQRVTEYLTTEGWQVGPVKSSPQIRWMIEATDSQKRSISVSQELTSHGQSERLLIFATLKLSSPHVAKFKALRPVEQRDLIYELRQQTIMMGIDYAGLDVPLNHMLFEDFLYVDDLSKSNFLKTVRKVRNATVLSTIVIARRFNEPLPSESAPNSPLNGK
jgi:hypothetical protein